MSVIKIILREVITLFSTISFCYEKANSMSSKENLYHESKNSFYIYFYFFFGKIFHKMFKARNIKAIININVVFTINSMKLVPRYLQSRLGLVNYIPSLTYTNSYNPTSFSQRKFSE